MILKKWWAPILSVPLVTLLILLALYSSLYPFLSHGKFGFSVTPQITIYIIVSLGALLIPLISGRLHRLPVLIPIIVWSSTTGLGMFFENGGYEGNQNLGVAGHFLAFQLLAIAMSVFYFCFQLKYKSVNEL